MSTSGGALFLDAVRKRIDDTLDACTRCGKCVEACPMVAPAGLDPANAKYYVLRSAAYLRIGKPEGALEDAQRAVELDRRLPMAYAARASAVEALNRRDEAITDFRAALALAPAMREAREGLGRLGVTAPSPEPAAPAQPPGPGLRR